MVELNNNIRFLANFMYKLKANVTEDPLHSHINLATIIKDSDSTSRRYFNSVCNQTMVGFVQHLNKPGSMEHHTISCFYGIKDGRSWDSIETYTSTPREHKGKLMAQIDNT
jgi:hypothetical protein